MAELTHAAKMLALIEAVQLGKAAHDILESDVEQTRIKRLTPAELRMEYLYWKNAVRMEVAPGKGRFRYAYFNNPAGTPI